MARNWTDAERAQQREKLAAVRRKRWKRFDASALDTWAGVKVKS